MKKQMLSIVVAWMTVSSFAAEMPQPTVWYRADVGVTLDADGKVLKWVNQGSLGSDLDLTAVDAAVEFFPAGMSSSLGSRPQLSFPGGNGTGRFRSAKDTVFGVTATSGATIFQVYYSLDKYGFWGIANETLRTYADLVNTSFRFFWFHASSGVTANGNYMNVSRLATMTVAEGSSKTMRVFDSGLHLAAGNQGGSPVSGELVIGATADAPTHPCFKGRLAEFRVYSQELSASERFCIEGELAAKYSIALKPDVSTTVDSSVLFGMMFDPAAMGSQTTGKASTAVKATSGDLVIGFGASSAADANTLVYLAHDVGEGAARSWAVVGSADARALPLTLEFADSHGLRKLYHRADFNSAWQVVDVAPTVDGASITFDLPAGWSNGHYSLKAAMPQPTVWFRADKGATTNADGKVTNWANQGSLGELLDLTAQDTGVSYVAAGQSQTFGGQPLLSFPGGNSGYFKAPKSAFGCNATSGATLFQVYHATDKYGFWSVLSATGLRTYADCINSSFRFFWFNTSYGAMANGNYMNASRLATMTVDEGSSKTMRVFDSGLHLAAANNKGSPYPGELVIGAQGNPASPDNTPCYKGALAEFRVYNRELTVGEHFCIEGELAAKYALPLKPDAETTVGAATLSNMVLDPAAMGTHANGKASSATSLTSGELTVSFATLPAADANSLVYAAHDAGVGASRAWVFAGASGARAVPLSLTFEGAAGRYCLYYRQDASGSWRPLSVQPAVSGKTVSFTLPADWSNGQYRVGEYGSVPTPTVWYKADDGVVTNDDGQVTRWLNRGTLGAGLDLVPSEFGAGAVGAVGETLGNKPVVRFSGDGWLGACESSTLGLSNGSGMAIFIVHQARASALARTMPYGLYMDVDNPPRFWVDSANSTVRNFYFSNSCNVTTNKGYSIGTQNFNLMSFGLVKNERVVNIILDGKILGYGGQIGTVQAGKFRLGHSGTHDSTTDLCYMGDIAEVRVYNQGLTAAEEALVEMELAAKYALGSVRTVGDIDVGILSEHGEMATVLGSEPLRGTVEAGQTLWYDGTLSLRLTDGTARAADVLTYVGADNGTDEMRVTGAQGCRREMDRTWYVATEGASVGGEFTFPRDGIDDADWQYRLYCRPNGSTAFLRLPVQPVVRPASVAFAVPALQTGTYKFVRKLDTSFVIVVE